jgi:hypothetical protein
VYLPSAIVPTVEFPPVMPLTCQITAGLEVLLTVTLKVAVPEVGTEVLVTSRLTVIAAGGGGALKGELAHPATNNSATVASTYVRPGALRLARFDMNLEPRFESLKILRWRGTARCFTES